MTLLTLDLNSAIFRDKISGCWMGKNCGGTLGAPLEKMFGEPEPFDVWWYPRLEEGGIPNDDLEMQLIWLKALEEVGPSLRAKDLAQYWLDHIGYNWDEYGLNKTNLRLGLLPPVSGYYNNWFRDAMGCPIRSEIWACIAPGVPSLAVRYAYEDAICDHAGGESIFGEMFNAAIESAAFVISDRELLLNIGLSYVPGWSKTYQAVAAAREAYAAGLDWRAARQRVLAATPHYNAQYSPINMGFQVIGWLYGEEFGDALCKAVNCGYDTDCTGATLGSILGIIAGRNALPEKWTEPLGDTISTNASWGGLQNTEVGPNSIPSSLTELNERVIKQAYRVLATYGFLQGDAILEVDVESLYANEEVRKLWTASPLRLDYTEGTIHVGIDYLDNPVLVPGEEKKFVTHLSNPHPTNLAVYCELCFPNDWLCPSLHKAIDIPAHSSVALEWSVPLLPVHSIGNSNRLFFTTLIEGRPAQSAIPIVLVGANRFLVSDFYPMGECSEEELFDNSLEPEQVLGEITTPDARPGNWHDLYSLENVFPLEKTFEQAGALYIRTFLWSPTEQAVWLGAPATSPAKMWVNQQPLFQYFRYSNLRPNYGGYGGESQPYAATNLQPGWNEVLIKFVRSAEAPAFEAHFILSGPQPLVPGLATVGRTRAPWDSQS